MFSLLEKTVFMYVALTNSYFILYSNAASAREVDEKVRGS